MSATQRSSPQAVDAIPEQLARLSGLIDIADIRAPELLQGYALWNMGRGQRLFPARDQMSPRRLGRLLPHVVLVRVLDDGREFQIRVAGDGVIAAHVEPLVGLTTAEVDNVLPGYGSGLHQLYSHVCMTKTPIAFRGLIHREPDNKPFNREHLLVPLGETDHEVDHLISFIVYLDH